MTKIAKLPPRGSRYGPFLSVGKLLDIESPGLKDTIKVQFLPQWETDYDNAIEAVLSKRFAMVDMGVTDLARSDLASVDTMVENIAKAVREKPDTVLKIANAFGQSGSREDREAIPRHAADLDLTHDGGSGPMAIWGVLIAIGAAILISSCCNETDTDCGSNGTDTDDDKGGGTGGGTSGGDTD